MTSLVADGPPADAEQLLTATRERGRISTGHRPLDVALHGGYPDGYAILLSSPSCDERDLLLRRFLEADADRGLTIYLTRDFGRVADLAAAHRESFYVAVCNGSEGVPDAGNVAQAPMCDDLCSMNIAISTILGRIQPQMLVRWPRRFVIDLLSDVLLSRRAVVTRSWLWNLLVRMKARGFTILAVLNPRMHPPEDAQAMLELFDGHIAIEERASDVGPKRSATVRMMYACEYDRSEVLLDRDVLMRPLRPSARSEPHPRLPWTTHGRR